MQTMSEYQQELLNGLLKINKQSWSLVSMIRESMQNSQPSLMDEEAGSAECENIKVLKSAMNALGKLFMSL